MSEPETEITRAMARLERRAVRARWNIPDKFKDAIVNRQVKIAIDPEAAARDASAAAKVLLAMEAQNMAQEEFADRPLPAGIRDVYNTVIIPGDPGSIDAQRNQLLGILAALSERSRASDHPAVHGPATGAGATIDENPQPVVQGPDPD